MSSQGPKQAVFAQFAMVAKALGHAHRLELLEQLITGPDVRHLLLVGAYRDNEVTSSHPLARTLAAIRKAGAKMPEIVLTPLKLDSVDRLVADALRCEPDHARPLAELAGGG